MDLQPSIVFSWPEASGSALRLKAESAGWTDSEVYTDAIATAGADQIGLFVFGSNASTISPMDVLTRVQWGFQLATDIDAPQGSWADECVVILDGATSGGAQRSTTFVREFRMSVGVKIAGINGTGNSTIWIPAAAHYLKVGCMTVNSPVSGSSASVYVERGRTGSPSQQRG
jgi:hypothetical protein